MKKLIFSILALTVTCCLAAQEGTVYKASLFGCVSDGITHNTTAIQAAVDLISEKGGGSLHFFVGKYLTGTIRLKNNVTIVLHEGATLVGIPSIHDYDRPASGAPFGLIIAEGQRNIGIIGATGETPSVPPAKEPEIIGMGIILGNGAKLRQSIAVQEQQGYFESGGEAPALISFVGCDGVKIEGLMLMDAAGDVQSYKDCRNVSIANQLVDSRVTPGSAGISFGGCSGLSLSNNFFEVTGKPIRSAGDSRNVKSSKNRIRTGVLPGVAK